MPIDNGALARKFSQPMLALTPNDASANVVANSHEEAILAYGELAIFTLMWRQIDFDAGLVGHCSRCFVGTTARQAEAFMQPNKRNCPVCYGTTYEGGYRAQIIRPVIMADRNSEVIEEPQGVVTTDSIQFETTDDFYFTQGDYLFRFDGSRFQCDQKNEVVIRTGFSGPNSNDSLSGMSVAHLEDTAAPAYSIPPTDLSFLNQPGPFTIDDLDKFNILIRLHGYL